MFSMATATVSATAKRELEVVGIGHDRPVGRIEMDQAEHLVAAAHRRR